MIAMVDSCNICTTTLSQYDAIIFFVDNTSDQNDPNRTSYGIMTFNQRYGMVYPETPNNTLQFYKTIGHELGHEIFELRHPFDHDNNPHDAPGYPQAPRLSGPFKDAGNLMDYDEGGVLIIMKYLWDVIHK